MPEKYMTVVTASFVFSNTYLYKENFDKADVITGLSVTG